MNACVYLPIPPRSRLARIRMSASAEGLWHNVNLLPSGDPDRAIVNGAMRGAGVEDCLDRGTGRIA